MRQHENRLRGLIGGLVRRPDLIDRIHLVSARFEPTYSIRHGGAILDLSFSDGHDFQILPGILAPFPNVILPESTPLLWPSSVATVVSHSRLDLIERDLMLWLRALTSGRRPVTQRIRFFVDDARTTCVKTAQRYNWLAASSYSEVATAAAPGAFVAARYANATIHVSDQPSGATGAWILARENSVKADLGSAPVNAAANQWFGTTIFDVLSDGPPDVALAFRDEFEGTQVTLRAASGTDAIHLAEPLPIDGLLSFDLDDGPVKRTFFQSVRREPALRSAVSVAKPGIVGGSAGKIAFVLRADGQRDPDADTESASVLANWLTAEGLQITLCDETTLGDLAHFDLVHLHGLHDPQAARRVVSAARAHALPVVVSAQLLEALDPYWAIGNNLALYLNSSDLVSERRLANYFSLKRLVVDGTLSPGQPRHPDDEADLRAVLSDADEILVGTAAEAQRIERRFGIHDRVTVCAEALEIDPSGAPIGELVGTAEFVLCSASLADRNNLLHLVRACREADLRLVLCGPVVSVPIQAMLSEYIDERVILVPHATPAQRAALYRRARVYVEPGFLPYGLSRIARAVVSGCAVVASHASDALEQFGPGIIGANPLNVSDLAVAIARAWELTDSASLLETTRRAAAWVNPLVTRTSVAQSYARAVERQTSVRS